ncbi:MAG: DUF2304 domain-containing protein [Actinobacteria bacterium]|nr:DUF2304 domain-containing protein [Actinomycetota bacterium]
MIYASDGQSIQGGLSTTAHVFLFIGTVASIGFILFLLRRRQLRGKYALLWTAFGIVLGLLAVFPNLLTKISELLGVSYPPILFAVVAIGFLLVIVIQFSWELTRQEDRTRTLAEELALLRSELEAERRDHADG